MAKVSFRWVSAGGLSPAFETVGHFFIDICLEIGDFSIPDCFFSSLKKSCCKGDIFLFVRLTDPSRT